MPTGQEMCEYIVKTFPALTLTPEELWSASQNGSLDHILVMYAGAREANGLPAFKNPKMQNLYESFLKSKKERR